MSHYICEDCGERYRGDHSCPKNGHAMLERIYSLELEVDELREEVEKLRALLLPRTS